MSTKTIYIIEARTGCSCCSDENFEQGPYLTEAEAKEIADAWRAGKGNPLASQYSKFGNYLKWD